MAEPNRIRAVVLDWAGTMIDFGCLAPARVFQTLFDKEGVGITIKQAREPMGMAKREHIAALLQISGVRESWRTKFGRDPADVDIDRLFENFLPLQLAVIADHCDLIPGALAVFEWCRENGIRVASTTGYTREIMEAVIPLARAAGYEPEVVLCAQDAPAGRPAPWMIFECAKRLNVFPTTSIVKVDDTIVGVQAGLNAGVWSVGVAGTGNLMGVSEQEFHQMDADQSKRRLSAARETLQRTGAHFVIDSIAELPAVIRKIDRILENRVHESGLPFLDVDK